MVMEFLEGETFEKLIERGPMPIPRAVALCAQVLDALQYAHAAGVVHRDLKPANVIVTPAGDIKVMDFGIARAIGADHLTRTGMMVGTLRYMSPEQLRGEEIDHRADLYALGVVLYEVLTGRGPFRGGSEYEILRAQMEAAPTPPAALVPGLPPWLDQAVLRALAKFPSQRFESAAAMAESLSPGPLGPGRRRQATDGIAGFSSLYSLACEYE
jgi:serine/threonine-protein kinase